MECAVALAGFDLPEGLAQAIAGWVARAEQGALLDGGHHLSKLIGRSTTPLSVAAAAAPKQHSWARVAGTASASNTVAA